MTDVRVNEGNILSLNESSLNLLEKVKLPVKQGMINLNCKYGLQETTGFKIISV